MSSRSVLVFDPIRKLDWSYDVERSILAKSEVRLIVPADKSEARAHLPDADLVIASGLEPITAELIGHMDRCVAILCYSSGKDAVDLGAAARAGIEVANLQPSTDEVADHALALLLAAARRIVPLSRVGASDVWDLDAHPEIWAMPRLKGRVLGIVGPGAIGRAVATRARGFGLETIATYRTPDHEPLPDLPAFEIGALFARSDFVVLTAPLTPETHHMVNRLILKMAKPGLILVNVGRGGLIDEEALAEALDAGRVSQAALDVRECEPPDRGQDPLRGRPDVITTPHVGGASDSSRDDLHRLAGERVLDLLSPL
ncbi:MAG: NAD(P)-dependent oxidoreductase [Acidimicrobiia bacterium]|jgi:D-3-phosphoglycerate dehydrogenase